MFAISGQEQMLVLWSDNFKDDRLIYLGAMVIYIKD